MSENNLDLKIGESFGSPAIIAYTGDLYTEPHIEVSLDVSDELGAEFESRLSDESREKVENSLFGEVSTDTVYAYIDKDKNVTGRLLDEPFEFTSDEKERILSMTDEATKNYPVYGNIKQFNPNIEEVNLDNWLTELNNQHESEHDLLIDKNIQVLQERIDDLSKRQEEVRADIKDSLTKGGDGEFTVKLDNLDMTIDFDKMSVAFSSNETMGEAEIYKGRNGLEMQEAGDVDIRPSSISIEEASELINNCIKEGDNIVVMPNKDEQLAYLKQQIKDIIDYGDEAIKSSDKADKWEALTDEAMQTINESSNQNCYINKDGIIEPSEDGHYLDLLFSIDEGAEITKEHEIHPLYYDEVITLTKVDLNLDRSDFKELFNRKDEIYNDEFPKSFNELNFADMKATAVFGLGDGVAIEATFAPDKPPILLNVKENERTDLYMAMSYEAEKQGIKAPNYMDFCLQERELELSHEEKERELEARNLRGFKEVLDEMYGRGFEVISPNGEKESFDALIDRAMKEGKENSFVFSFSQYDTERCYVANNVTEDDIRNAIAHSEKLFLDLDALGEERITPVRFAEYTQTYGVTAIGVDIDNKEMTRYNAASFAEMRVSFDEIRKGMQPKEIDFMYSVDETSNVIASANRVNAVLNFEFDKDMKEVLDRTSLLSDLKTDYDTLMNMKTASVAVYADITPSKDDSPNDVKVTAVVYGINLPDYDVPITAGEKRMLIEDIERAAYENNTSLDELIDKAIKKGNDDPPPTGAAGETEHEHVPDEEEFVEHINRTIDNTYLPPTPPNPNNSEVGAEQADDMLQQRTIGSELIEEEPQEREEPQEKPKKRKDDYER